MNLKHVEGRVVCSVDTELKNSHRFADGTTIRLERQVENFNRRHTEPVNATVISSENIPEGAEVLISHNALHDVNKIFNHRPLSGKEQASSIRYYSIKEEECFAWRNGGRFKPTQGFQFALRVFEPYKGILQGIEPKLIPNVLFITTGSLAGNICHVLKASDYEVIYQGGDGREKSLIRLRHSDEEEIEREEVVAIDHAMTEKLNKGELLIGLTPSTATELEITAYAD